MCIFGRVPRPRFLIIEVSHRIITISSDHRLTIIRLNQKVKGEDESLMSQLSVVLHSPVLSGLWAIFGRTGTRTGTGTVLS